MPNAQPISVKRYHTFLVKKFLSMERFTKQDMVAAFGDSGNFNTYWTKKIRPLLFECDGGFRLSEYFRKFLDYNEFAKHWSQTSRILADYEPVQKKEFICFQLLLPLSNELILRQALDDLFYTDRLVRRIKVIERSELLDKFPMEKNESESAYYNRITSEFAKLFGGYSISHVNGRYRGLDIVTSAEAADLIMTKGITYLFDETTAIIRFIKPIEEHEKDKIDEIEWIFQKTFMQTILESVNGEAEIWLMETGLIHRLLIWKRRVAQE